MKPYIFSIAMTLAAFFAVYLAAHFRVLYWKMRLREEQKRHDRLHEQFHTLLKNFHATKQ
jgi:hypothetical protein